MLRHLGSLGYPCPALTNPADFILDISSVDVSPVDGVIQSSNAFMLLDSN